MENIPEIGVSACLLGETTRYDGREVTDVPLCRWLSERGKLIPLCPETGAGMPVPRPPIHLVESRDGVRAVDRATGIDDVTDAIHTWFEQARPLVATLDGVVLKSRSPSCGTENVPLAGSTATTTGLFTAWLLIERPHLPIIDEIGMADDTQRVAWWERVVSHAGQD